MFFTWPNLTMGQTNNILSYLRLIKRLFSCFHENVGQTKKNVSLDLIRLYRTSANYSYTWFDSHPYILSNY